VRKRLSVFIAVVLCWWASSAFGAPTAKLVDPTARLDYGAGSGTATMVLQVDNLDDKAKQDPALVKNIHDLNLPSPPNIEVSITTEERPSPGATSKAWLLILKIAGMPPGSEQKRYVALDLSGQTATLDYTLTNKAISAFTWTVKAPASMAIHPPQAIPVSVSVASVPATRVTLINPFLSEKNRKSLIAQDGLQLCRDPVGPCQKERIDLPANSVSQLWMRGATGVGQYEGTITIAAAEKPEGDAVSMTVYSTQPVLQVLGVVAIFGGVVLAWVLTVFARNLLNRDQMLRPAALLVARINTAEQKINGGRNPTGRPLANIRVRITRLTQALSPAALPGLPGLIPLPYNAIPSADQLDTYRRTLQSAGDWVADLEAIIQEGLEQVWPRWQGATQQQQGAISAATDNLDGIVQGAVDISAPPIDSVRQQVRTHVNGVNLALAAPALGVAPPAMKTYDQLTFQITQLSIVSWALVIIATTAVGTLALVANNSFGSPVDFLTCVLWGLGLPIGGQAISASMGTVGTALGISIPK
jgi:hypothetical protein